MRLKEFMIETGATERQIEYWSMVMPLHDPQEVEGSGNYKNYKEEVIPQVKLFVDLSKAFTNMFPVDFMVEIFEHYDRGAMWVTDGVILNWSQTRR